MATLLMIVLYLFICVVAFLFAAYIFMLSWNFGVVAVFGVATITYHTATWLCAFLVVCGAFLRLSDIISCNKKDD